MDKKETKRIAAGLAILAAAIIILFAIYKIAIPKAQTGSKNIEVTVVHGDGKENTFSYKTEEEYLGPVLLAEGLAQGRDGQYGLFITTVDNETADESKQQWWCLTKGGETVNTGADQTPVKDGDKFELTLTEGY